jgi:hypothetical protein
LFIHAYSHVSPRKKIKHKLLGMKTDGRGGRKKKLIQ